MSGEEILELSSEGSCGLGGSSRSCDYIRLCQFWTIPTNDEALRKLLIPRAFTHRYEICQRCDIRTPDGSLFVVRIVREHRLRFFGKGWDKLCKHFNVMPGYWVLFQFYGNSIFDVAIFDLSATEIEYEGTAKYRLMSRVNAHLYKKRFFQVIVSASHLRKSEIPVAFMDEFGEELKDRWVLNSPNGLTFEVKTSCKDGTWYWSKGWSEFCQHFGVGVACFILFHYIGNAKFDVCIFDMSTLEIKYDESPCSAPLLSEDSDTHIPTGDTLDSMCFTATLNKRAVKTEGFLTIPKPQARMIFDIGDVQEVVLKHGEREYVVALAIRGDRLRLCSGWNEVSRDVGLEEGDICVFKAVGVPPLTYELIVYP